MMSDVTPSVDKRLLFRVFAILTRNDSPAVAIDPSSGLSGAEMGGVPHSSITDHTA